MIGEIRSAIQFHHLAHEPLAMALAHAQSGRPLNLAEVLDAADYLRRASDKLLEAAGQQTRDRSNVVIHPATAAMKRPADPTLEAVGRLFDPNAPIPAMPINGGDKPTTPGAA